MQRWRFLSLRWRIFFYFLSLSIIMISLLWFFQIVYLDRFYERIKVSQIQQAAQLLIDNAANENLVNTAESLAHQRQMCISIYQVSDWSLSGNSSLGGDTLHTVCKVDILGDCIIHYLSNSKIWDYYFAARDDESSVFTERFSRKSITVFSDSGNPEWPRIMTSRELGLPDSLIYARLGQSTDDNTYFVLLNASIVPMEATVSTLRTQLIWISAILVFLALILSTLVSNNLARPLARLTQAAHNLAEGDFSASFKGGNYREVNELSDALNYAASELGKAGKLQKDIVANISHDLRTPLTMIGGYAEYMRDFPEADKAESLDVIIDETKRLSRLVQDVLIYSRLDAKVERLEIKEFDFSLTLRDFINRYNLLLTNTPCRVELEIDEDVSIRGDEERLLQALGNILNNAVTHCGEDNLVIVRQETGPGYVRIFVIDHGPGIAPEILSNIWDRYYHADSLNRQGNGLGLSIVKGIMELHNAKYGVDSVLGEGSAFWFQLETTGA